MPIVQQQQQRQHYYCKKRSLASAGHLIRSKARHCTRTTRKYSDNKMSSSRTKEVSSGTQDSSLIKENMPLKVVLPPNKEDCDTAKLLTMDQRDEDEVDSTKKLLSSVSTTDNNLDKSTTGGISVEEFECGVSVAGSDKQEWSFTLYDFDGKGNITKDDLASLLKSLYDAVGSSIKLPQSGAKTLKLRLSVSPDNAKVQAEPVLSPADCKDNRHRDNLHKNNNLKHIKNHDNSKLTSKESIKQNNLSAAMDKLNVQVTVSPSSHNAGKRHHRQVRNNLTTSAGGAEEESAPVTMTMTERQQLAELVQQNMERHRRRQHYLRRHNSDIQAARHHHYQQRSSRDGGTPSKVHHGAINRLEGPVHQESQERRNYYLDLAGIDSSQAKKHVTITDPSHVHNDTAPAAMIASPRTPRRGHHHQGHHGTPKLRSKSNHSKRTSTNYHCDNAPHGRSRSHDVMQQVFAEQEFEALDSQFERTIENKVEQEVALPGHPKLLHNTPQTSPQGAAPSSTPPLGSPLHTPEKQLPVATSSPMQPKSSSTPKAHNKSLRPLSLPGHIPESVSPHHHRRHRNRERNRKLAMQQVAEWIEREHHSSTSWDSCGTEHVVIQKHEHHHVHEHHHHHHYHHYQET